MQIERLASLNGGPLKIKFLFKYGLGTIHILRQHQTGWVGSENGNFFLLSVHEIACLLHGLMGQKCPKTCYIIYEWPFRWQHWTSNVSPFKRFVKYCITIYLLNHLNTRFKQKLEDITSRDQGACLASLMMPLQLVTVVKGVIHLIYHNWWCNSPKVETTLYLYRFTKITLTNVGQ